VVKTRELIIFFLLLLLAIFFIYIYGYIKQTQDDIFTRIQSNKIKNVSHVLKNIENDIIQTNNIKTSVELVKFLSNTTTREKYENKISLHITPSIKYIYILHQDKDEKFRFLLDASKEDKANFYQKFDVFNPEYKTLYKTAKAQIIKQHDVENLYLTYLYPIKSSHKVIGILSVDITTKIQKTILKLIKPLETFFIILIIFIFLLMIMTVIQVVHYFITKKKIFTDPLTTLYNRNYLQEIVPSLKLEHYSIAMLDLDRFKSINDNYGHKAGDFVLAKSSEVFKKSIRDTDILIRYGGEEFLLFIYNRDEKISVVEVCERIRENIESQIYNYNTYDRKMKISIGVHKNPSHEKNLKEAIMLADKMLYIAKKEGRNRVVYYNENSKSSVISKSKDIDFVKQALENDRIICHYQAIYNPKTNTILKYEALVRIIDENGSIVMPGHFLPGLTHTNIHYKLTQRILNIVINKFKNNNLSVSININFSDIINEDIETTIIEAFKDNPSLASRVTFEILESDEIDNFKLLKEKIELLHSFGAKVSIDDFGSGYSNFKTIIDIEADYLKIDGSLVKNIDVNEKDFKIVKSIIHFARETNMTTVAEFVHSKEVYEKIKQLDIDYVQGYYVAKPEHELINKDNLF